MRALQADRGATAVGAGSRSFRILLAVAGVVLALDQTTKAAAVRALSPARSLPVIDGVLRWTLERNPGAAFGLFQRVPVLFTVLAFVISAAILVTAGRKRDLPATIALGLVLGGAVGNLADRLFRPPGPFRGHVVDFIDFRVWPTFNVADIAVVCGAILLAATSLRAASPPRPGGPAGTERTGTE